MIPILLLYLVLYLAYDLGHPSPDAQAYDCGWRPIPPDWHIIPPPTRPPTTTRKPSPVILVNEKDRTGSTPDPVSVSKINLRFLTELKRNGL